MPPYSNVRKTSLASLAASNADTAPQQRRTTSGRAIRANTTRPANYYARPFANTSQQEEIDETPPAIGFFPAITFFADAIDALPKEIVRQFTLMKEVEAKVHAPAEQLGALCDELMQTPVPRRKGGQLAAAAMMSFTAPNSNAGSANPSVINGVAPNMSRYGQESTAGSAIVEDEPQQDTDESLARRHRYAELRALAVSLIPNMDEKNVVLTEAIRVMNAQLSRINGVMPHVEAEIPEEARLGSMTHWAYGENRTKSKAAAQISRRDIGATNTLAAAASAMHDADIAQTRREGGRDNGREKTGRGKQRDQVDSEFEEKPRKTNVKAMRGRGGAAPAGLGITNGEPVKRRKVEKPGNNSAAPGMERQVSNAGRMSGKAASKGAPPDDSTRKRQPLKAPTTLPKRRGVGGSAHASPALASSPLSTHVPLMDSEQSSSTTTVSSNINSNTNNNINKQQNVRNRQNSSASNLRHERLAEESTSRPSSAAGKSNGADGTNTRGKRPREEVEGEAADSRIDEKVIIKSSEEEQQQRGRPLASRSNSSNKTPSGRASKGGTPKSENMPADSTGMTRTRSTRASRVGETTSEPPVSKGHRRGVASVSGLMKQIAPFNRSPDLDRHRKSDSDNSSTSDPADDGGPLADPEVRRRRSEQPASRPTSSKFIAGGDGDIDMGVRKDQDVASNAGSDADERDERMVDALEAMPPLATSTGEYNDDGNEPNDIDDNEEDNLEDERPADEPLSPSPTPEARQFDEPDVGQRGDGYDEEEEEEDNDATLEDIGVEAEEEEDDGEDPDPDDPNEPKYCYCQRGSYGDMVGCDNPKCPREWFHLGCTDLTEMPSEEESWFCNYCRPKNSGAAAGRRGTTRGKGRAG